MNDITITYKNIKGKHPAYVKRSKVKQEKITSGTSVSYIC